MTAKFLESSRLLRSGDVKTSSQLKMWWLTTFKGYSVDRVIKHPKHFTLGRLVYDTAWILRPKK